MSVKIAKQTKKKRNSLEISSKMPENCIYNQENFVYIKIKLQKKYKSP